MNVPTLESGVAAQLTSDYQRFAVQGLPRPLEDYVRGRYALDLSSEYGGRAIKNPFGKASGQLSLNLSQVRRDAQAGLGFVVLKTVIAEDAAGAQSMQEWAIPETRMAVEPITGRYGDAAGRRGWTVTWKGRGWYDTLEVYLNFYGEAIESGREAGMVVAPSVKYHLPRPGESEWRVAEYENTTNRLMDVWEARGAGGAMPLEKDFSPTLAGSDRAAEKSNVLGWLRNVAGLIRRAAGARRIAVGLKLFNAVFEDDFQLEMLHALRESPPDFLVYANRLFDPEREFEGVRGVAYGGPDLSARNLAVLARQRTREQRGEAPACRLPISATGNIDSGQTAAEYLLRGAGSFQMHTFFQLPDSEYGMKRGNKSEAGLHELLFHPERGFLAWLLRLRQTFGWPENWNVKKMAEFCADPRNGLWK